MILNKKQKNLFDPKSAQELRGQRDLRAWNSGIALCGLDEVGRGSLAGPVLAGALVLCPIRFLKLKEEEKDLIRDSKLLNAARRKKAKILVEEVALAFAVGLSQVKEIECIGIQKAIFLAMARAMALVYEQIHFQKILFDGKIPLPKNFYPAPNLEQETLVHGDFLSWSIAGASILAKEMRDELMREIIHPLFPQYGFDSHVGYGTKSHREAIQTLGPSSVHRMGFLSRVLNKTDLF